MKVLYISSLVSRRLLHQLYEHNKQNMGFAVQKFHYLLSQGLVANGVDVQTLSAIPISCNTNKSKFFNYKSERENGVKFNYAFFISIPIIKHICLFLSAFFNTIRLGWGKKSDKFVLCDVLNISICMGALWASKIVGIRCVGVMTDMPGLMVDNQMHNFLDNIVATINKSYLSSFTHYIFLTEQMNETINRNKRPYIIMEGLVDADMGHDIKTPIEIFNDNRTIMYAGGLHERYGVKMLVDAFMQLKDVDIRLALYGSGPMEEYIKECASIDKRVCFYGVCPNDKIVEAEMLATLLVNPRPTHEDFTKYSFPSKNMEYMVSGTPLLTTALPGMPQEYYEYVYIFEQESVTGYLTSMQNILSLSITELQSKGHLAKSFVLKYKNNKIQAERIVQLIG